MVDANVKIIAELKAFLETVMNEPEIRKLFTNNPNDFSRERKMPLNKLAALLINLPKRSLSIELQDFFKSIGAGAADYTKGAFCLQRAKLKPVFFSIWNKCFVDGFYHYYGSSVKRWKGFRLMAVDGSTAYLFNKKDVKMHFGTQDNQHTQIPMARIMEINDVLNDMSVWGGIFPIAESEQQIMANNIVHLPADSLTLFDRGYPGYALMSLLLNQEEPRHFVMRCRSGFNNIVKDFVQSGKVSQTIELTPNKEAIEQLRLHKFIVTTKTSVKVRMVKVKLSNGEQEILLTSLYDEQLYPPEELKHLYGMRWGIETNYNRRKNQQQVEQFSGHKVICIKQDYAAGLFTLNLQSLIEKQTEQYIASINKRRKHSYKINKNVSLGVMKNKIVKLFLEQDSFTILQELEIEFSHNVEPVRPGRSLPRTKMTRRLNGKYQTVTNYRRAV